MRIFPVFHLQISERDELLHYFYSKFEKSFIAGLCKELARGTHAPTQACHIT